MSSKDAQGGIKHLNEQRKNKASMANKDAQRAKVPDNNKDPKNKLPPTLDNTKTQIANNAPVKARQTEKIFPQDELNQLRQDIASIREEREKENTGINGWSKRWGGFIAIIVSLFALPHLIIDIRNVIELATSGPVTKLIAGDTLNMSYDENSKEIKFDFDLTVENQGNKREQIREVRAEIKTASQPTVQPIRFDITNIKLTENGAQIKAPLFVKADNRLFLNCTISSRLDDASADILRQPGMRRLTLTLISEGNKSYSISFCFYADHLKEEFLYPTCSEGELNVN
jgi:hypothetical protein